MFKKIKIIQKIYLGLILAIIFGIILGLLFAGYLVGDIKTTGNSIAIYTHPIVSNVSTSYFCKCNDCKDSIYGKFIEHKNCIYNGAISNLDIVSNSCKECCLEYNCDYQGYILS